jgi:c(7)-type cytochrome triheme protein
MRGRGPLRGRHLAIVALLAAAPVIAAAYPAVLRIPPRAPRPSGPPPALFSHRTHGTFGCQVCHPGAFPLAAVGFSHEEMNRGAFCGGCHDGRLGFAIKGAACARCHVPVR